MGTSPSTAHTTAASAQHEPSPAEVAAILEALKKAIWERRPILGEIMRKHGGKILQLYAKDFMDVNPSARLDARKPELIAEAKSLTEARLGKDIAEGMAKQLSKFPLVSTTDHHGPITHPFFLNANLISGLPYSQQNDPDLRYLVVFSFASVSVNNASAYPRGILFHGGVGSTGNFVRLPILPDKLKMGVVYGMRGFTRDDLDKAEIELQKKEKAGEIAVGRGDLVRGVLEEFFARKDVLKTEDLNSQITIINYHLWPKLFHPPVEGNDHAPSSLPVPDLLYLEIETLVTKLLIGRHLGDRSSLIYRVLFDPDCIAPFQQHFNNLPGAFSLEKGWGTYCFWGVDDKLHRVKLMLVGNRLRSGDGNIDIEWSPGAIAEALDQKKIFPSMLLSYLLVSLYYGMKCLGGFCQVNDLTVTKEAWMRILRIMGEADEVNAVEPVQTKELGGDGMVLPYYAMSGGDWSPATGIDMVLHPGETRFDKYAARSAHVTLSEMMNPMLPEIYSVLYPITERDQKLLSITPEQILKATGLQEKLTQGLK